MHPLAVVQGQHKLVDGRGAVRRHLVYIINLLRRQHIGVLRRERTGRDGEGGDERPGIVALRLAVLRQRHCAEIVVGRLLQRPVAHRVGAAVNEADRELRLRHHGRGLGDLVHALLQAQRLGNRVIAHHVEHGGVRLHHVGGNAAAVGDGVVHPGRGGHVLAQILHADVHQLHGVQGAAALVRVARRVGGHTGKAVFLLDAGEAGAADGTVNIIRVPGDGRVQAAPGPVPGHEGLARAALLAGTAEEDDGAAAPAALEKVLHRAGGGQGAGAQQIMVAAVAGLAPGGALRRRAAHLAQA